MASLDDAVPHEQGIHPQWQAWVAENLARGADRADVVAELVAQGVSEATARAFVTEVAASPGLREAVRLARRVAALEQIVRLRHQHRRDPVLEHREVERRTLPDVETFMRQHWAPGVPAIFTDLVPRWPAFGRWSLTDFATRFADVTLEACVGRAGIEDPDPEWAQLRNELSMASLIEAIEDADTNDVYVIAKNAALRRPGLAPLLDEIDLPSAFFGETLDPARMGLWLGGAGTHTPLHHDGDDVMFCQVVGRKRFRLAAPESLPLLEQSRGVYSQWDPIESAELAEGPEPLIALELAAGEALFIPAGWWHQVDSLEPSISVSILKFAWPSDYAWYKPGTALAGRRDAR